MILGQNPHYVGNVSTQEEKDALIAKYGNQALRPAVKMSKSLATSSTPMMSSRLTARTRCAFISCSSAILKRSPPGRTMPSRAASAS